MDFFNVSTTLCLSDLRSIHSNESCSNVSGSRFMKFISYSDVNNFDNHQTDTFLRPNPWCKIVTKLNCAFQSDMSILQNYVILDTQRKIFK